MASAQPSFVQKNIRFNKLLISLIKLVDRKRYYEEKRKRAQLRLQCFSQSFVVPPRVEGRAPVFKHAGNAGDIIYALPAVRELAGSEGGVMKLQVGALLQNKTLTHPLGGVMLNQSMIDKLIPLLATQPYIKSVSTYESGPVDFDLDLLRSAPVPTDRMCISRWYFYLFGVTCDLSHPWLRAKPAAISRGRIVVARSLRYRNLAIDYSILNRCAAPLFVGIEEEYRDFIRIVPSAEWAPVRDFLELAEILAGARLFVGNQSFPFSVAEGLKIPRILEVDPGVPNVIPTGARAHDVLFQSQFARALEVMLAQDSGGPDRPSTAHD